MSAFLGMDVAQAEAVAERMGSASTKIEGLTARLDAQIVGSGDAWIGSDGDAFRHRWTAERAARMESLGDLLREWSAELRSQARDQDDASAVGPMASGTADATGTVFDPNSNRHRGTVDPAVEAEWRSMAEEFDPNNPLVRWKGHPVTHVASAMIEDELEKYGIHEYEIEFVSDLGANGVAHNADPVLIRINLDLIGDPGLLHTLAHEARHAAQFAAIKNTEPGLWDWLPGVDSTADDYEYWQTTHKVSREEIEEWRHNFDGNYQEAGEEGTEQRERYYDQPVEVDARKGGREFVEGLTLKKLYDFQDEVGYKRPS